MSSQPQRMSNLFMSSCHSSMPQPLEISVWESARSMRTLLTGLVVLQAPTDLLPQPDVIHDLEVGRGLRILEDVGHL